MVDKSSLHGRTNYSKDNGKVMEALGTFIERAVKSVKQEPCQCLAKLFVRAQVSEKQ